jgi:hypothetical protein
MIAVLATAFLVFGNVSREIEMNKEIILKELKVLQRKEHIYRDMTFIFLGIIFILLIGGALKFGKERGVKLLTARNPAPYSREIFKAIRPLEYSGIEMLEKEDARISLDFENKSFTLHNFRKVDEKGNLVLEKARYGTCEELAIEAYRRIQPILGGSCKIEFIQIGESGYFLPPTGGHTVLKINKDGKEYILDPSFKRYGPIEEFEDYSFLRVLPNLALEPTEKDKRFPIGTLIPLLIRGGHLVGLMVSDNEAKFDAENFLIGITLLKKHTFLIKNLFALRKDNGMRQVFEDVPLHKGILNDAEYAKLRAKVISLFEQVKQGGE